jgi:glycosyltransferase involved in cell wall biosynthesis
MKDNIIFILPFILPWDRSADYQRQTCYELSKKHRVIAYMQRDAIFILKALFNRCTHYYSDNKNISFYRPLYIFPFRRIYIIEKINQSLSFILFQIFIVRLQQAILWIFDPEFCIFPELTNSISLYDCVDYHAGYHRDKKADMVEKEERILIKSVNYFFVNSYILYDLHKKCRKPDAIVPQGFKLDCFLRSQKTSVQFPKDKPIIGCIGALDYRLNWSLLKKLVQSNRQWLFVLWGSSRQEEMTNGNNNHNLDYFFHQSNVIIGESTDYHEIPSIIEQFDIGIIPYDDTILGVKYSYPMKLIEYFYAGKPVISTTIGELSRYPKYIKIGNSAEKWETFVKKLLRTNWPRQNQIGQRKIALKNTWDEKISMILKKLMNYS